MTQHTPISGIYQIPLNVHLTEVFCFANFVAGQNQQLLQLLQEMVPHQDQKMCIVGPLASGKTHLLQASCTLAQERGCTPVYLDLADLRLQPAVLEGLEQRELICLDNVDQVVGQGAWEEALFHCYNRSKEVQINILFAFSRHPKSLSWHLPDLLSRITWGMLFSLQPLTDEHKRSALKMRAHQRGLVMSDEVCHFILTRLSRDPKTLFEFFDHLDQASMIEQRKLTVPFVKQVMATLPKSV